jgi:hypothetical protein
MHSREQRIAEKDRTAGSPLVSLSERFEPEESRLAERDRRPEKHRERYGAGLREHFKTVCYGVRAASRKEEISGWCMAHFVLRARPPRPFD